MYEWHVSKQRYLPSLITLHVLDTLLEASCVLSWICCIDKTQLSVGNTINKSELLQKKLQISSWIRNEENNHKRGGKLRAMEWLRTQITY